MTSTAKRSTRTPRGKARKASQRSRHSVAKRPRKKVSLQRRRARALLVAAGIFAAIVLATSLPVSELLSQQRQLSSASQQLSALEKQNKALSEEAQQLSNPSTVVGIARRDYGLVAPGSQAYEILPSSGASAGSGESSGHVPLEGPPVVPGSAQSQGILAAGTTGSVGGATGGSGSGSSSSGSGSSSSASSGSAGSSRASVGASGSDGGFWTRVVHTLEFWR